MNKPSKIALALIALGVLALAGRYSLWETSPVQPASTGKERNHNTRPKPRPQKDPVNDALGGTRHSPASTTTALLVRSIAPANSGLQQYYFHASYCWSQRHLCALCNV